MSLTILYQLKNMGISEADVNDTYWGDAVKVLPDGKMMLVNDIKKALQGEGFSFFTDLNKPSITGIPIPKDEYSYYTNVFYHCEDFGLPSGKGWNDELPWLIQLLTHLKSTRKMIEYYVQEKAMKKAGR